MVDKYYKKYIEKLIDVNPTEITLNKVTLVDDGYSGYIETPITVKETVTFYERKSRIEIVSEAGSGYRGVSISKVLAKGTSQIEVGDMFEANGYNFRVKFVKPYFDICKQVEVDVIE